MLFRIFTFIVMLSALVGCRSRSVKDVDGNRYATVRIGDQTWMAENLRTTRYNDGTPLPLVTKYDSWVELSGSAYCWYNNDSVNGETYGALYNWYAVESNKLCPAGWHVPTDDEWKELRIFLVEEGNAGDALKEKGTEHWKSPNEGANNSTGFTGLPGGYRSFDGTFNLLRSDGFWWSSTESVWYRESPDSPVMLAFHRNLRYDGHDLFRYANSKSDGISVRCIKDQ
jgi:uncharacterized protein (TIGR02145 family)